jgi:hypothetical protein
MQPIESHSHTPIGRVWQHGTGKVSQLASLVVFEAFLGQAQLGANCGKAGLLDRVMVRVNGRLMGQKANKEVGQNNFARHNVSLLRG